jgi:hypothetical protein
MSVPPLQDVRSSTNRPCYVCDYWPNPIIAREPMEYRLGRPVLPEPEYACARCRRCGTLYVDSDVTDDYLYDFYKNVTLAGADNRLLELTATRVGRRLPEFRRNWRDMKRARAMRSGDRLLDVGCDEGDFGTIAGADGALLYGVELSHNFAEIARQRWGGNSHVYSARLNELDFAGNLFAYVTCFETLEHMCTPIEALKLFHTWLLPDGIVTISVPSSDYFQLKWILGRSARTSRFLRRFSVVSSRAAPGKLLCHPHIYHFSPLSIRRVLEIAGFRVKVLRVTGWHGRFGPLLNASATLLFLASRRRIALAPSVFAIAERA